MSESIQSYEKDQQSNAGEENPNPNQNDLNESKEDDGSSRFIIKRTEPSDIFYFTNPLYKESKANNNKNKKNYHHEKIQ